MKNEQSDELSSRILGKVKSSKQNVLIRKKYMDLEREKAYAREAGRQQGLELGKQQGIQEGLSVEQISRCIKLPIERVKELAEIAKQKTKLK